MAEARPPATDMAFQNYFLLSSFACVASGFVALVLTGRLDPVSPLLYAAALVGAFVAERFRPHLLISRRTAVTLSALAIPLCAADLFLLGGNPFLSLARFAFYISAVKLFQVKADSDWVWLYALTFCEVLLAASMTIDPTFLFSLGLFLFFAVTTLGAFEVTRAHRGLARVEEETDALRAGKKRPLRRALHLSAVAGVQLVLVALISVPIFLLMPRFGGGALGSAFSQTETLSGFSETVRIGDLDKIKQNPAVVMHVRLENDQGRTLRWRGIALDTFDGQTWKAAPRRARPLLNNPAIGSNVIQVNPLKPGARASQLTVQTIYLEPLATQTLFAASRIMALDNAPPVVRMDGGEGLTATNPTGKRLIYTALSDVNVPPPEALRDDVSTDYPADVAKYGLQLPALDARIRELTLQVVGDAQSPYDQARRVEEFLRGSFAYSLEPQRADASLDPITDFLLNTRTGHCEYFATAMVLMLRSVGIPSRVVNGFQMGEYNAMSGTYTVRQLDAHSWVEVYFPGAERWVEFDPTPAAGTNVYTVSFAAQLRQSIEALQLVWIRYVVALDSREQVSLVRRAQRWLVSVKDRVRAAATSWRHWMASLITDSMRSGSLSPRSMLVAVAALIAVGLISLATMMMQGRGWSFAGFVVPVWRWRGLSRRARAPERTAVRFYEQMLAMLGRHGISRASHETPKEFAAASEFDEVRTVTEYYHRVRFGGDARPGLEREVAHALAGLAARLRKR